MDVAFEDFHECENIFYDVNEILLKGQPSEKLEDIEQEVVIDVGCPFLFVNQQEVILHVLQNYFSSMLQ